MKRMERALQTIIIPHSNLLQKDTILGQCRNFEVESRQMRRSEGALLFTSDVSLMFFTGTPNLLGATVLLHGEDEEELRKVKATLKKLLIKARDVYLETDFMMTF